MKKKRLKKRWGQNQEQLVITNIKPKSFKDKERKEERKNSQLLADKVSVKEFPNIEIGKFLK